MGEEWKLTAMVEWAKAAISWGDAATLWEVAVKKTPVLSEVHARWVSVASSWKLAAGWWVPQLGEPWPPGTSESFYWAAVAHRWARTSKKWAAAAERYPGSAHESLGCATSALDWASAAVAWAKPQSISEEPLSEWARVAAVFAAAGEHAAELAARAGAGPVSPHPPSAAKSGKTTHEVVDSAPRNHAGRDGAEEVAAACAEDSGNLLGEGVDSVPENHATREDTVPSLAVTEPPSEKRAPREDTASTVASGKASVTEKEQATGTSVKPFLPKEAKSTAVAVHCAAAETAVRKDKDARRDETASSVAATEPSEKHASSVTASSVASGKPSVTEKEQATGSSVKKEKAVHPPNIYDHLQFPVMPPTDPKQTRPPKPGRQRQPRG